MGAGRRCCGWVEFTVEKLPLEFQFAGVQLTGVRSSVSCGTCEELVDWRTEDENVPHPSGKLAVCREFARICWRRARRRKRFRLFTKRGAWQRSGAAPASLR